MVIAASPLRISAQQGWRSNNGKVTEQFNNKRVGANNNDFMGQLLSIRYLFKAPGIVAGTRAIQGSPIVPGGP